MKENERLAMEEAKKDREILRNRVESDKLVCIIRNPFIHNYSTSARWI